MKALEKLAGRQHLAVSLLSGWLILTSPWVALLRRIPSEAGFLDYSHIVLGCITLLFAITYTITCTRAGRWRLYFPWLAGQFGVVARDVGGMRRGRIPAAEGGGLFAMIEGVLLVLLLATAVTGALWLSAQGAESALNWRGFHIVAARGLAGFIVLHVVTVSLHLIEFVRD
jgi:hypothetical protein